MLSKFFGFDRLALAEDYWQKCSVLNHPPSFLYLTEGGLDKPTSDNKYGMSFDARPFSLVFSMIMH